MTFLSFKAMLQVLHACCALLSFKPWWYLPGKYKLYHGTCGEHEGLLVNARAQVVHPGPEGPWCGSNMELHSSSLQPMRALLLLLLTC